jgi:thiamine-phosphate pyrophosphorylase
MRLVLPRLYMILDAALLTLPEKEYAKKLVDAGVRLIQYRNKQASPRQLLDTSRELAAFLNPRDVKFVVNDRADVAAIVNAAGVHVGQDDLDVEQARRVVGIEKWVGFSTHNEEQFRRAADTSADYIAVGPVFATESKMNPDPVVGTELVRKVRAISDKPIVAIGGITLERAADVIRAGADSVAVISDILRAKDFAARAREYIDLLEAVNSQADSRTASRTDSGTVPRMKAETSGHDTN